MHDTVNSHIKPLDDFILEKQISVCYLHDSLLSSVNDNMVGVAQLVERRVVASVVVGSNPITHPIL